MFFSPGQSGNMNGRPNGSRNKYTQEVVDLIKAQGHQDPLTTLNELQATAEDPGIRASAANMLAPYLHSKLAAKPQPPDPIFIQEAISLPRPTSIGQATDNISRLGEMKAQGQLDFATCDSLIGDQKVILYALIDNAKLIASIEGPEPPDPVDFNADPRPGATPYNDGEGTELKDHGPEPTPDPA